MPVAPALDGSYWLRSKWLVAKTLAVWAIFAYVLPLFVTWTNEVKFLGFPLGYYICVQVIPVFFAICLYMFTCQQEAIDESHGAPATASTAKADGRSSFERSLGKVYAIYTGGFFGFVGFLAILEAVGVPQLVIGVLFVIFTLGVYAGIGIMSHTNNSAEYFVAGRTVPPVYNGMATAADWMSGASFVGMAGSLYTLGYDGLAFIIGWTGGYVLVATLIAPYLRRVGSYTVPDFIAARYKGKLQIRNGWELDLSAAARFLATLVLITCSFTYLTAQVYSTGVIMSRFVGLPFELAVFAGLAGVLVCSLMGGMRAVTWTQVAQYIVLIVAYIIPVVCMSTQSQDGFNDGNPIAQIAYGGALKAIVERQREMVAEGLATEEEVHPYTQPSLRRIDFFALSFCLMVGTASLPHVLMRYFTTPSVRGARRSVTWSLVFILALYLTAPAYAAFSKLEVYTNIIGQPLSAMPEWLFKFGEIGLMKLCGQAVTSMQEAQTACNAASAEQYLVRLRDLVIAKDAVVIATPEIAGLPYVIAGLVSAGGLAAALSTADGLLLAISNALSHDIYYRLINDQAPASRRMLISRVLLIIIAVLSAALASTKPSDILSMVAWAFSLAASGNFPALALGIWWRRANAQGAVAGIIAGWGLTVTYLLGTRYGGWEPWFGISNTASAIFGLPVGLLTNVTVSLLTAPPPQEIQDLLDKVRDVDFEGNEPEHEQSKGDAGDSVSAEKLECIAPGPSPVLAMPVARSPQRPAATDASVSPQHGQHSPGRTGGRSTARSWLDCVVKHLCAAQSD